MEIELKRRVLVEHIMRRNLSQNGFAQRAGLSSGYMAQLLHGHRHPSPRMRERLMTATGLDFDTLFKVHLEEEAVNA